MDTQNGISTDENQALTADEIALYDRQIRLWGVKAQESIQKANVLLIGMKALANEVAKNLVLAGIRSLTIVDHEVVTEKDLGAQFFINESDVGKNRAEASAPSVRELNNRVEVLTDTADIRTKFEDPTFLASFNIIIATDIDYPTSSMLNAACRLVNKPFYSAGTHGFYGYIFADLIVHDFIKEQDQAHAISIKLGKTSLTQTILDVKETDDSGKLRRTTTLREEYSPLLLANTSPLPSHIRSRSQRLSKVPQLLPCLRALWEFESRYSRSPAHNSQDLREFTTLATEKHKELGLPPQALTAEFLRKFLQNLNAQLAPVTAMLGGSLAQDVINVIGKREQPIQNLCLFNGDDYTVLVYPLHPGNFEDDADGSKAVNGKVEVVAKEAMPSGPIVI